MRELNGLPETKLIRALIVDDEPLARARVRRLLQDEPDVVPVGEAANGHEAVHAIRELSPDLVFLDIQMPEMDGFAALAELAPHAPWPAVIFVTAYDQYALQAFEVNALDYLLKPYERARFAQAVQRARAQLQRAAHEPDPRLLSLLEQVRPAQQYLQWLSVKHGERVFLVRTADLDWVEAEGNYVRLHVGRQAHFLRETLSRLAQQLDPQVFLRVQRSAIVNINRIRELQVWTRGDYRIVLHDGTHLTLSRKYRANLDALLGQPL